MQSEEWGIGVQDGLFGSFCTLHSQLLTFFWSVNAKQLERPALQAGPSRCESDHGHQSNAEL